MTLHQIISRLRKLGLSEQIHFLRGEYRKYPPRSIMAGEIAGLLKPLVLREIKKEMRMIHIGTERSSIPSSQASAEIASA